MMNQVFLNGQPVPSNRILHLSLKQVPFEVMLTGEKQHEFRRPSNWIKSRIQGRQYDVVKFTNGYGSQRPYFIAEYLGFTIAQEQNEITYSNDLVVQVMPGDFIIKLGSVSEMFEGGK